MYFSDATGIQMNKLKNEEDNWMIASLMRDKSKLKRLTFILGGIIVTSFVAIAIMTAIFLNERKQTTTGDSSANAIQQDKGSACRSSPCYNGGQCTDTPEGGYSCICPEGHSGSRCEETPCDTIICLNAGLCRVENSAFSCICKFGYYGDKCQFDPCQKNPCLHGGECEIKRPDYSCTCPRGYSGKNCQVTPCDSVTCQNGGICINFNDTYKCQCPDDYIGHLCQEKGYKDYLVMFSEGARSDNVGTLLLVAAKSGTINVTTLADDEKSYPLLSANFRVISLPKLFFTDDKTVETKGIRVRSNIAFNMFGYIETVAGDGFMAIPTQKLGTEYVIIMYKPYKSKDLRKALFGIVSLTSNNNINITVKTQDKSALEYNGNSYETGDVIQVKLHELETFQLSHTSDLSGTTIKSENPIGVFAGNKCNSILEFYCNSFLEMLLPNTQADKLFVIPTIERRDQYFVRVYCHQDSDLSITIDNATQIQKIKAGNFYEYTSPHVSVINASHPVSVYGFPKDIPNYDSYMTTFMSMRQWKPHYMFAAPDNSLTNHISVVFCGTIDDCKGFVLDSVPIEPAGTDVFTETVNRETYVTFRYQITSGEHTIHHLSNITFGLWIYGEKSREGYGYPGGVGYF